MPLLDQDDFNQLRRREPSRCNRCAQVVRQNYCRTHDEFYWSGHAETCGLREHTTCRTYDLDEAREPDARRPPTGLECLEAQRRYPDMKVHTIALAAGAPPVETGIVRFHPREGQVDIPGLFLRGGDCDMILSALRMRRSGSPDKATKDRLDAFERLLDSAILRPGQRITEVVHEVPRTVSQDTAVPQPPRLDRE